MANLANGVQFAKFFHANSHKYSEITEDLPADSPKFSSPLASSVLIRQNFLPPNFPTYGNSVIIRHNFTLRVSTEVYGSRTLSSIYILLTLGFI